MVGGTAVATAKQLRRQAATCAVLAKQTQDEEGRQRYLRLEQMYLQLAEAEDQIGQAASCVTGSDAKSAA